MLLLQVNSLKTVYYTREGTVRAVDGVSFTIKSGENVGLVGESGCGKSTVALSILRLLPANGSIPEGQIIFKEQDILKADETAIRGLRGKEISMCFQGAMNALNPVKTVGDQIVDSILLHEGISKEQARKRTEELFEQTGISHARLNDYPHQLSGGMKQRAMMAMALCCDPQLLLADEPVTALDVMVQAQLLELIKNLSQEFKLSILMITHDLSVVVETCERVIVMYAGKVLEDSGIGETFLHPYTTRLFGAFPNIEGSKDFVSGIPGTPPDLRDPPPGCPFHPRCDHSKSVCESETPELTTLSNNHRLACHRIDDRGGKNYKTSS